MSSSTKICAQSLLCCDEGSVLMSPPKEQKKKGTPREAGTIPTSSPPGRNDSLAIWYQTKSALSTFCHTNINNFGTRPLMQALPVPATAAASYSSSDSYSS